MKDIQAPKHRNIQRFVNSFPKNDHINDYEIFKFFKIYFKRIQLKNVCVTLSFENKHTISRSLNEFIH